MSENVQDFEDEGFMNVAQVIALDIVLTVSLAVALNISGQSLFVSLLGAWIGGAILTVGSLAAAYMLRTQAENRNVTSVQGTTVHRAPPLVPKEITDPMQVWEEDRMLELDYAYASGALDTPSDETEVSVEDMIQQWTDDAAAEGFIERRVQPDRRQNALDGRTDRRRAAG